MKPLEFEKVHYDRIIDFFDDTVARIVLAEEASAYDSSLEETLLESGNRRIDDEEGRLTGILTRCREILDSDIPVDFMAGGKEEGMARAVPSSRSSNCNYIILSPRALDLEDGPLAFIIGHEFSHIMFRHQVLKWIVDVVYPDGMPMPPYLANEYSVWRRCAELSADRGGLAACGDIGHVRDALAAMDSPGLPAIADRIECLVSPEHLEQVHNRMLRKPEDEFQLLLVKLLVAAGGMLMHADGNPGASERSYLVNRISRHSYCADLQIGDGLDGFGAGEASLVELGEEIRTRFPERRDEAFLNLAVIIVRDGRVTDSEYRLLKKIGSGNLGIDEAVMHRLLLRVFRSGFYSPFEE